MIQKLNPDLIVQILSNQIFPSGKIFNYDKGQWVQFLMQSLKNPNVLMVGRVKDKKLQNFSVTIYHKGVVSLLYISDDVMNDNEYKEESINWSKGFETINKLNNIKTWDGF